ncbi:SGNH/GDSL hydrolase family protein [Frateuria soli]|uniref:SGNH/GDSL hydrolase family protein n=1 Tax=Frateuria soli TaxID=1542730 RepID=UPI001E3DCDE6|nr:SGNH/GDSL hydrolase family protein [Frateuria soli]UGB38065.1 GDSL-type esterase/lipase family protein [Frateuria soli]
MRFFWSWLLLALLPSLAWACAERPGQWQVEIAAFAAADRAQPPPAHPVLFVGSSSIRLWSSLTTDFPGRAVINRGFGGSRIPDATYYADRLVAPYHPRAIVLYAGDNDLAEGCTPEQVRDAFAAFVRRARSLDAGVPIAFIAIKPSMARKRLLPQIRRANALVRKYARARPGISYLDVFTPMLGPDGQPQPEWFGADGLHMNRKGYRLWTGLVRDWLHRTLDGTS